MAKKLFEFWSINRQIFFAFVDSGKSDDEVQALAMAATSDANKEYEANMENGDGRCHDGLCVEESIKARLTPLGFEFITPLKGLGRWEDHYQDETLLEARLRVNGIQFERTDQGNLVIPTPDGDVIADVANGSWSAQGTTGVLKGSGAGNMIYLIQLRIEKVSAD